MRSFNRDDRPRSRRDFGRRDFGRQMYKAVCSNCGKDCEVPFEPTSGKPVYCSDCFEKRDTGSDSRRSHDRRNRPGPQNNEQLETISRKLDKILEMLKKTDEPGKKAIVAPKKKKASKKN